ncbi:50S ribosomal protein L23 [Candidatus Gottesmanbacteria bacterium RBG_13_45_10]|uniref:Large ribosomal subunit protein uL23 n=1 Tax=Candidatus Gottesmanbacteria bacterium RBG_13_45_10 TaxID=1798370 RepID=A0A1F5ZID3_9BACT|nr:MAG: 50S ribosomal protein L23 [Candidatus Gottesmanbacteria bacterium RBG_13_45_10]
MKVIAKRPLISEKTLALAAKGWYTFVVDDKADKQQIAGAINAFYSVNVIEVRSVTMHGKVRRVGKAMKSVKRANWKKAMVRLASGQKIDAFEVTTPEASEAPKA